MRTSVCSTIVVHANSAIDDALANDSDLHALIVHLATANINNATTLDKHNQLNALANAASKLRETAISGEEEVRRLRALAANSPEPRKTELKEFADAIGGALYRQRVMAIDAQRAVVVQQGREEAQSQSEFTAGMNAHPVNTLGQEMNPNAVTTLAGADYDKVFKAIAAEFVDRAKLVAIDEGVAADHGLGATTGC